MLTLRRTLNRFDFQLGERELNDSVKFSVHEIVQTVMAYRKMVYEIES